MRTIKAAVEQANTEVQQLTTKVIAATYDNETGIAEFTTDTPHGFYIGTQLTFTDQVWRCEDGTEIFPRATDTWFVSERISDTRFKVQMSTSSKVHTYDLRETEKIGGGTVKVLLDSLATVGSFTSPQACTRRKHRLLYGPGTCRSLVLLSGPPSSIQRQRPRPTRCSLATVGFICRTSRSLA